MADDKTTKPADDKTTKPAAVVASAEPQFPIGKPTGNLTRDSIIETHRGTLVAAGTPEDKAHEAAVKRGFEMIPG
jgi:hypothetical protein